MNYCVLAQAREEAQRHKAAEDKYRAVQEQKRRDSDDQVRHEYIKLKPTNVFLRRYKEIEKPFCDLTMPAPFISLSCLHVGCTC